jgi:hypothetical protein
MFALSRTHSRCIRPSVSPTALLAVSLMIPLGIGLAGCKRDADQGAPGASAADEVGRALGELELPVSLRAHDTAPTNAHQVEATTEQLRLNGAPVIALQKGEVAEADQRDGVIGKLESALRAQGRSTIALRLQAIIPYKTMAMILNTAKQAGVMNAAFAVREPGGQPKTGWLNADNFVMSSKADDVPNIPSVTPKSWDAFTAKWKSVTEACRTAQTGNCAYADANFARGGVLKIELFVSGRGINIDFYRRGLTADQEHEEEQKRNKELAQKKEQFLQGHLTHDQMVEFLLLGDPSTQALFQFRYQEALNAPSALSGTMSPLCQGERCGVLVAADDIAPMVRVISMLGAAFPDGAQGPIYAFEMPWTKKPKPTGLPEWASREMEKNALLDGKVPTKK